MLMIEGPKFSAFNFSPDPSGSSAGEFLVINGHRILLPQKKATPLAESEKEITSGHQDEDNLTHTAKTAASVWDCSIVLSKYLEALAEKSPEYWNGKRVLELGAGQGIVSFSAAAVGARQVIITDIDSATQTLREGVALNGFEPSQVQVTALDWTNRAGALQHIRRDLLMASPQSRVPLDCILASDVVWVDYLIPDLVNTVADLIDNSMEEAWETFDNGSETQDLDTVLLDPKFRKPNIAIWKIWKDEAL
ncbi:hypothetical protein BGX28_005493 [Mortierella sp. GBA30]|nr:hypothetical protein BGX28_005493 [Mortierella sp. GBA30]